MPCRPFWASPLSFSPWTRRPSIGWSKTSPSKARGPFAGFRQNLSIYLCHQITGAAFGMFPQLGGIFMVIAVVVVVAIVIFYHHLPTYNLWVRVSLGLQLGGALGNLVDRITRGYVVDFVDIGFWPIFNIADMSIVLGVTILAYFLWSEEDVLSQVEKAPNLSEGGNV
ncbi:MAG: signal peptidase II [Anaerolineales bacterium]|nr:signal peptidase II [Anaerolineales bacterium]